LREWGRGDAAPAAGTRMLRRPAIDVAEIFIESVSYDSFIYFRKLLRNNGLRTTVPFVSGPAYPRGEKNPGLKVTLWR